MDAFYTLPAAFIQNISGTDWLIILAILLLLFGAKKLPELARGVGKSMKEFKKAQAEVEENFRTAMDEDTEKRDSVKPPEDAGAQEKKPEPAKDRELEEETKKQAAQSK